MEHIVGGKQPNKMNMSIDIENAEDVICPYCEDHKQPEEPSCNVFIQAFMMKKIGALQSPTGKDAYLPVPIFICSQCGLQLQTGTEE